MKGETNGTKNWTNPPPFESTYLNFTIKSIKGDNIMARDPELGDGLVKASKSVEGLPSSIEELQYEKKDDGSYQYEAIVNVRSREGMKTYRMWRMAEDNWGHEPVNGEEEPEFPVKLE